MGGLRREIAEMVRQGTVIPAHPLALTAQRTLDERRQRALTRYYLDAGAGGLALAVHTTQFEIRESRYGLLRPVLELAAEEMKSRKPEAIRIAGVCGDTRQAVREARFAVDLGYDIGLVSLAALPQASDAALLEHCRTVAEILPIFGFYLQPAVGGRTLSAGFWRRLCGVEGVVGIKIAPFDRYRTLEVVRAVAEAGAADRIALYTGNDDHILFDLLVPYAIPTPEGTATVRLVGGLLGHWAFWTRCAVEVFDDLRSRRATVSPDALLLAHQITDVNQAVFDARHGFAGCLPGIHEMLRRSGLLAGRWCLDPGLDLSPGQLEEIDRVSRIYPHLADDTFVEERLDEWLR